MKYDNYQGDGFDSHVIDSLMLKFRPYNIIIVSYIYRV